MPALIRVARPDDLPGLLALDLLARHDPLRTGPVLLGAAPAEPDPYRTGLIRAAVLGARQCLVVDGVGGPAGYALRRPAHLLGHDLVELLVVDPRRRRQGLGAGLLRAAAAQAGSAPVWTYAAASNLPVRALLAGDGWRASGGIDGSRIESLAGEPALLFSRPGDRPGRPGVLYHLAGRQDWERAVRDGAYRVSTQGATLAEVGFIHASFAHQVAAVARRYYQAERRPLVLLEICRARLVPAVRIQPAGDEMFPHLYGPLDPAAVAAVHPVSRDATGRLLLPPPA